MGYLSQLLQWHLNDPPDEEEKKRNDKVCAGKQALLSYFFLILSGPSTHDSVCSSQTGKATGTRSLTFPSLLPSITEVRAHSLEMASDMTATRLLRLLAHVQMARGRALGQTTVSAPPHRSPEAFPSDRFSEQ